MCCQSVATLDIHRIAERKIKVKQKRLFFIKAVCAFPLHNKLASFCLGDFLPVCVLSLPLWKQNKNQEDEEKRDSTRIGETLQVSVVVLTLIAFFLLFRGGYLLPVDAWLFCGNEGGQQSGNRGSFGIVGLRCVLADDGQADFGLYIQ